MVLITGSCRIMIRSTHQIVRKNSLSPMASTGGKHPQNSRILNPIENLWHELKEYIRQEVKPRMKAELVERIQQFWETMDFAKCIKYIRHLRKVIPRVIEVEGDATGY